MSPLEPKGLLSPALAGRSVTLVCRSCDREHEWLSHWCSSWLVTAYGWIIGGLSHLTYTLYGAIQ